MEERREDIMERLEKICKDSEVREKLYQCGFRSAQQISAMEKNSFARRWGDELGIDRKQALQLHAQAVRLKEKVMHYYAALRTTASSTFFKNMKASPISREKEPYFDHFPNYQELFGELKDYEFDKSATIFGFNAYFTDLMRIVERYITEPNEENIPVGLMLKERRGDLWKIPLSKEFAEKEIPYTKIINERLVDLLNTKVGKDESQVFEYLGKEEVYPFLYPRNIYLDLIKKTVSGCGVNMGDIVWRMNKDGKARAAWEFGISDQMWNLLAGNRKADIGEYYGMTREKVQELSKVRVFCQRCEINVDELLELVGQGLSEEERKQGTEQRFFINSGESILKIKSSMDLSEGVIENLTDKKLDILHRIIRLAKITKMSYETLDYVLCTLAANGNLDENVLEDLAKIIRLKQYGLDPGEAASLIGNVKLYGGQGHRELADFLNTYKQMTWKPEEASAENAKICSTLSGFLKISMHELQMLVKFFYGTEKIVLDEESVSCLYRHAMFADKLGRGISEYLMLLEIYENVNKRFTVEQIKEMIELNTFLNSYGKGITGWSYVVRPVKSMLSFTWNAAEVGEWRNSIRELAPPEQRKVYVLSKLSDFMRGDLGRFQALVEMYISCTQLPDNYKAWEEVFLASESEATDVYVVNCIDFLGRWNCLADWISLPLWILEMLGESAGHIGILENFQKIPRRFVYWLVELCKFVDTYKVSEEALREWSREERPEESDALLAVMTGWKESDILALKEAAGIKTDKKVEYLKNLQESFEIMDNLRGTLELLFRLTKCLASSAGQKQLQAEDIITLQTIYEQAKEAVLRGSIQSDIPKIKAAMESKEEEKKRDILLPYVMEVSDEGSLEIRSEEALYQYLLIDINMGGETKISYVKEAVNAVQLYMQRCRLHLEPGIVHLNIPKMWWSYIMNYTFWEKNRNVFVFPENFLISFSRKTKTKLFQDVENALMQSNLDKGYMEEIYLQYLDEFHQISQLTVVDSMKITLSDGTAKFPVLYLFGRTKQQPYTFYYCSQKEGMPFSEWEKIDLTIQGEYITPIYAFHRLYIFWVEQKELKNVSIETQGSGILSKDSVTYKLDIYCSFLNIQGKWVSPQSIAEGKIIYHEDYKESNGLRTHPAVKNQFQKEHLSWLKLYAFCVKNENLEEYDQKGAEYERLVLTYGMPFKNTGKTIEISWEKDDGSERSQYEHHLSERLRIYNRMNNEEQVGYLPLESCIVLNEEMELSNLLFRSEYILFDSSWETGKMLPIKMVTDYTKNVIGILYSTDVLRDNYTYEDDQEHLVRVCGQAIDELGFTSDTIESSTSKAVYEGLKQEGILDENNQVFIDRLPYINLGNLIKQISYSSGIKISPGQLKEMEKAWFEKAEGTVLFHNIETQKAVIRPVINQPGWFLFSYKDECFLLKPQKMEMEKGKEIEPFCEIGEGMRISRPAVNEITFYSIDKGKDSIFVYLRNAGIIDTHGWVNMNKVTRENVKNALPNWEIQKWSKDQIEAVYRILMDYPIVQDDIFWNDKVTKEESIKIIESLREKKVVDMFGRVDTLYLAEADSNELFGELMKQGIIKADKLNYIYDRLYQVPRTVAAAYYNHIETGIELNDYMFEVVRLSNGAEEDIRRRLFWGGLDSMFKRETQQIPVVSRQPFERMSPDYNYVAPPEVRDGHQVDFSGLYGNYYWEIFYHIPMLAAETLKNNGKYEEAKRWLEYIFNPNMREERIQDDTFWEVTEEKISKELSKVLTETLRNTVLTKETVISKEGRVSNEFTGETDIYSIFEDSTQTAGKVTREQSAMVKNILLNYQLASPKCCYWNFIPFRNYTLQSIEEHLRDGSAEMEIYNNNPFDAHAIARIHMGAYEKYTLISYVKLMLEWADNLFMEDTWESISFATMLYVISKELLGERPERRPVTDEQTVTYEDIEQRYTDEPGGIPQFLIYLEDRLEISKDIGEQSELFPQESSIYFKIPENGELLLLWDTIEDRLKKIRGSMNIYGEKRTLDLNERSLGLGDILSINSGDVAGGLDLSNTKLSDYKFLFLLERAKSMITQMTQQSNNLLSILEKKDANALTMFRERQEQEVSDFLNAIKKMNMDQIKLHADTLERIIEGEQKKIQHYTDLLTTDLIEQEQVNMDEEEKATTYSVQAAIVQTAASAAYALPQVGSPFAMTYGGVQIGAVLSSGAAGTQIGAIKHQQKAGRAAIMASYARRRQGWEFEKAVLEQELSVLEKKREAYQKEYEISSAEYKLQILQGQHKQSYYKMLSTQFTNEELYQWLLTRTHELYRQMYQCGLQMLRMVQKAYQYECDTDERFIPSNLWDTAHKGLTAGDNMMLTLLRMEQAYIEHDRNHFELEKIISLANEFPEELENLKQTGKCKFSFSEKLFDADYDTHYLRKIKSISVSVPVILPPYEMIRATLSQVKNCVLLKPDKTAKDKLVQGIIPESNAVRVDFRRNQKIAISRGVDDAGISDIRFTDNEYLPFEGTGAISEWVFSMPRETNKFNFDNLSDVLIKMRYTAKEDESLL